MGTVDKFPYVATTYRLTEHFHYWTKNVRINAILQPEQFVEIGEVMAKELGIANGSRVKVSSNRGYIKAVALVTKRLRPLTIEARPCTTWASRSIGASWAWPSRASSPTP